MAINTVAGNYHFDKDWLKNIPQVLLDTVFGSLSEGSGSKVEKPVGKADQVDLLTAKMNQSANPDNKAILQDALQNVTRSDNGLKNEHLKAILGALEPEVAKSPATMPVEASKPPIVTGGIPEQGQPTIEAGKTPEPTADSDKTEIAKELSQSKTSPEKMTPQTSEESAGMDIPILTATQEQMAEMQQALGMKVQKVAALLVIVKGKERILVLDENSPSERENAIRHERRHAGIDRKVKVGHKGIEDVKQVVNEIQNNPAVDPELHAVVQAFKEAGYSDSELAEELVAEGVFSMDGASQDLANLRQGKGGIGKRFLDERAARRNGTAKSKQPSWKLPSDLVPPPTPPNQTPVQGEKSPITKQEFGEGALASKPAGAAPDSQPAKVEAKSAQGAQVNTPEEERLYAARRKAFDLGIQYTPTTSVEKIERAIAKAEPPPQAAQAKTELPKRYSAFIRKKLAQPRQVVTDEQLSALREEVNPERRTDLDAKIAAAGSYEEALKLAEGGKKGLAQVKVSPSIRNYVLAKAAREYPEVAPAPTAPEEAAKPPEVEAPPLTPPMPPAPLAPMPTGPETRKSQFELKRSIDANLTPEIRSRMLSAPEYQVRGHENERAAAQAIISERGFDRAKDDYMNGKFDLLTGVYVGHEIFNAHNELAKMALAAGDTDTARIHLDIATDVLKKASLEHGLGGQLTEATKMWSQFLGHPVVAQMYIEKEFAEANKPNIQKALGFTPEDAKILGNISRR
jgi:hypothetical protein